MKSTQLFFVILLTVTIGGDLAFGQDAERSPAGRVQSVCRGVCCGPQPGSGIQQGNGEPTFESLVSRGVRSLICVDTIPPDVDAARAAGLVVVHIPTRYSGIDDAALASLQLAADTLPQPIYVHCHHGQHRGPAAAAILGRILGGLEQDEAMEVLTTAGTDRNYVGLWNSVQGFSPRRMAQAKNSHPGVELVPQINPPARAMVMKTIDQDFRLLVEAESAGEKQRVAILAQQIAESFREWKRYETEVDLSDIESAYQAARSAAELGGAELRKSCTDCHQRFR